MAHKSAILCVSLLFLAAPVCQAGLLERLAHFWQGLTHRTPQPGGPITVEGPQCLAAGGSAVDWWVALKLPEGNDLAYLDSQMADSLRDNARFTYMNAAAAANTSLSATLQQLYTMTEAGEPAAGPPGHIMYSNEPPLVDPFGDDDFYAYTSTRGRGVLAYGEERGFWLVHSVPSYPQAPHAASYAGKQPTRCCFARIPIREASLAHSFLCVSATTKSLRSLAEGLQANAHYVYSEAAPEHARSGLTDAQLAAYPSLYPSPDQGPSDSPEALATATHPRIVEIASLAGERFVMFANGGQVAGARNLMGKLVDTFFGSGMIMTGASPVQPQPCTLHGHAYPTLHAKEMYMEDARQTWDAAADRSSWAISLGNARTSARCAAAEEGAADMAAGVRDIADDSEPAPLPAGVPTWEEEISDEQGRMHLVGDGLPTEAQPLFAQTMTRPVTSLSRRLLAAEEAAGQLPRLLAAVTTALSRAESLFRTRAAQLGERLGLIRRSDDPVVDMQPLPAVPLRGEPMDEYMRPDESADESAAEQEDIEGQLIFDAMLREESERTWGADEETINRYKQPVAEDVRVVSDMAAGGKGFGQLTLEDQDELLTTGAAEGGITHAAGDEEPDLAAALGIETAADLAAQAADETLRSSGPVPFQKRVEAAAALAAWDARNHGAIVGPADVMELLDQYGTWSALNDAQRDALPAEVDAALAEQEAEEQRAQWRQRMEAVAARAEQGRQALLDDVVRMSAAAGQARQREEAAEQAAQREEAAKQAAQLEREVAQAWLIEHGGSEGGGSNDDRVQREVAGAIQAAVITANVWLEKRGLVMSAKPIIEEGEPLELSIRDVPGDYELTAGEAARLRRQAGPYMVDHSAEVQEAEDEDGLAGHAGPFLIRHGGMRPDNVAARQLEEVVSALEVPCGPQSASTERSAVCFTDLGRSTTRADVTGGAACFAHNPALWQAFRAAVQAVEPCMM